MPSNLIFSRCLRCGKSLKDHVSKTRGYGPECWEKVRHALPPAGAPQKERRSISNIFTALDILDQIHTRVLSCSCPSCGATLHTADIHSYDHQDGLNLRGFLAPQWVYLTCSCCQVDISLHKLTRDSCGDLCKHSEQRTLAEALGF